MTATHAYVVIYEDESDGGVSAYVPDLAVFVSAPTRRQARRDISRGVELYLEQVSKAGQPMPEPSAWIEYVTVRD